MVLEWLKKKPQKSAEPVQEAAVHYLLMREKQKAERLSGHIQRTWATPEEERAFRGIEAILNKHKPLYVIKDIEAVRKDQENGLFNEIPEADREVLARLSRYSWMIEGFSQEMAGMRGADVIYTFFEAARHQRLLAYHLYQLVERLEAELRACCSAGLQQFIYEALMENEHIESDVQALMWDALSIKQKEEMLQKESLQIHLKKLSLELARIMVYELKAGAELMERTLTDKALQKEPIAFEEEVGLKDLQEKILQLQKFAGTLHIDSLKQQLLAKQSV